MKSIEFQKADVRAKINPKNTSIQHALKNEAGLIHVEGATCTTLIIPTRFGKGVSGMYQAYLDGLADGTKDLEKSCKFRK